MPGLTPDTVFTVPPAEYSFQLLAPRNIVFMGADNKPAVTLDFDATPPTVTIRPGLSVTDAAKLFWNRTAQLVGQPDPFPDAR